MNQARNLCRAGVALLTLSSLAAWSCGGKIDEATGKEVAGPTGIPNDAIDGSTNDASIETDARPPSDGDASVGFPSDAGFIDLTHDDAAACDKRPIVPCKEPEGVLEDAFLRCRDAGAPGCPTLAATFDSTGCATSFAVDFTNVPSPLAACMRDILDRERLSCIRPTVYDSPCTRFTTK